jgi:hypothetical protein
MAHTVANLGSFAAYFTLPGHYYILRPSIVIWLLLSGYCCLSYIISYCHIEQSFVYAYPEKGKPKIIFSDKATAFLDKTSK